MPNKPTRPIDKAAQESYSILGKKIKTWKAVFVIAFVGGMLAASILIISNNWQQLSGAAKKPKQESTQESKLDSNKELLKAAKDYLNASDSKKSEVKKNLVKAADERKGKMLSQLEKDPNDFLLQVLPKEIYDQLPKEAQGLVEKEETLEGEMETYTTDDFEKNISKNFYKIKTKDETLSLYVAGKQPEILTGSKIRVKGWKLDKTITISQKTSDDDSNLVLLAAPGGGSVSGGGKKPPPNPTPVPSTLGEQRTLVILVNFQDNPIEPYTISEAESMMFGEASNFFLENSYQLTWLGGDVVGWYTIPVVSTVCDISAIASEAESAASLAGVDMSAYTHHVYAFPKNGCGGLGLSTVGGNPSQTWIIGTLDLQVIVHELGHALGIWHSHSLDCGTVTIGPTCTVFEYGHFFDAMGNKYHGHYNAFHKERLGWLNSSESPPITTVLTDGTYTLNTYEDTWMAPKAIKILKSTDSSTGERTWYYLESRQPVGFDEFLVNYPNVMNGILISTGSELNGNSSYLLDMSPNSGILSLDFYDPALVVNQTFSDMESGVSITTTAANASGATISVNLGTPQCAKINPSISVSPANQTNSAGRSLIYDVKVNNYNNSICPDATFNLTQTLPPGWTGSFSPSTLNIDSGSYASAIWTITSAASAEDGTYVITAKATDASNNSYQSLADASYVVFTIVGCGNGNCESGENCNNCPQDCAKGTGGSCSACFKGKCDGTCNTAKETSACSDCAQSYCCGDGTCSSGENTTNCLIDCACKSDADCNDNQSCTTDTCSNGICQHAPLACGLTDSCCASNCTPATDPDCQVKDCSACFKGKCDGRCNSKQEPSACPDCQ